MRERPQKFTLSITVTQSDHRRLALFAKAHGETLSTLIRGWINDGLEDEGVDILQPMELPRNRPREARSIQEFDQRELATVTWLCDGRVVKT